ncbi:MAG: ribosomal RNA small subunit methyltransferase A [Candidatus Sungbacteria bacterium]|nr:ribosomal RNA small subunit methyltransferase A [Candidatus Sungbacteria bacterium]
MTTLHPNKLLGQHFLTCAWVLPEMARAAELTTDDTVLEIGPGTGVLTRFLATQAKRVIAVEKDRALSAVLSVALTREKIANVDIVTGDVLRFDFSVMPDRYKVVANIPYYLTSRLIRILLETKKKPEVMALTIQKEVAERIVAQCPDMNILALSVHAYGTPEIVAEVPASCFAPRPKVDSAIIKIRDISDAFFARRHIASKDFFRVIRQGFSSRRKMLVNNLEQFATKKDTGQALISIGHPASVRAQELSLEEWAKLVHDMHLHDQDFPF